EFFPTYAMAPVVRQQTLERHPGLATHLNRLCAILDDEVMAGLNRRVDVDSVRTPQVASDFLRSKGLLE
ncbi:MAG TPA: glycine betaine ABC transporter substrate-binding protein, partial [Gemmatimonadales bacterium]|nr:glycine betaine ABC transporter substrate-binding protein [Gemmatimonadales bacterium]